MKTVADALGVSRSNLVEVCWLAEAVNAVKDGIPCKLGSTNAAGETESDAECFEEQRDRRYFFSTQIEIEHGNTGALIR